MFIVTHISPLEIGSIKSTVIGGKLDLVLPLKLSRLIQGTEDTHVFLHAYIVDPLVPILPMVSTLQSDRSSTGTHQDRQIQGHSRKHRYPNLQYTGGHRRYRQPIEGQRRLAPYRQSYGDFATTQHGRCGAQLRGCRIFRHCPSHPCYKNISFPEDERLILQLTK